jgi:very-short-patch-repair endonuclease
MKAAQYRCELCGRVWNRMTERMRQGKTCSKRCASIKGYLSGDHPDTGIELKVQEYLNELGISFEKQVPVLGITVADVFVSPNLAIFADGDYWHRTGQAKHKDNKVKTQLEKHGYIVLRLTESEINTNKQSTLEKISNCYAKRKITKCL